VVTTVVDFNYLYNGLNLLNLVGTLYLLFFKSCEQYISEESFML
jgi:hypothetical protein